MSKKNKKKNQQRTETYEERVQRIAREKGVIQPKEDKEEKTYEAESGLNVEEIPNNADDETLDFALKLKKEQERLKQLEQTLFERLNSFDKDVEAKVQERIDALEMDLPTAQAKYKDIINEATKKADDIIKAAEETKKISDNKQKELDEIAEKITKEKIKLESDKAAYKIEIGNEISDKYKNQIKEIDTFEEEKNKLERKVEYFKNSYETANKALTEAKEKLSDYTILKFNLESKESDYEKIEQKCKDLQNEIKVLKDQLLNLGTDPIEIQAKYNSLQLEYQKAFNKIKNCPSDLELSELRRKAEDLEKLTNDHAQQQKELLDAKLKANKYEIEASQAEDYLKYVRILTESKRQLQNELDSLREQYESENNNKFKALTSYDKEDDTEKEELPVFKGTLNQLVNSFIGFAQNDNPKLYYKINTISAFISWMACTKIIVLEGLSGTGKTSLPLEFEKFAGWYTPTIAVQSAWKDRNDLVGFFNDFKKEYKETDFLKSLYKAELSSDKPSLIVLDEMNISRIEYYFADFLSELEHPEGKRNIDLLPDQTSSQGMPKLFKDGGKLPLLPNVWFIGTANKDDSTFDITDKVYDRSGVIKFLERALPDKQRPTENGIYLSYTRLKVLFEQAFKNINYIDSIKNYYEKAKKDLSEDILLYCQINIGNRMIDQLDKFVPVYLSCIDNYTEEGVQEALDEFFPNKILRKLDNEYGSNAKQRFNELLKTFTKYNMVKCKAYMNNLITKLD